MVAYSAGTDDGLSAGLAADTTKSNKLVPEFCCSDQLTTTEVQNHPFLPTQALAPFRKAVGTSSQRQKSMTSPSIDTQHAKELTKF